MDESSLLRRCPSVKIKNTTRCDALTQREREPTCGRACDNRNDVRRTARSWVSLPGGHTGVQSAAREARALLFGDRGLRLCRTEVRAARLRLRNGPPRGLGRHRRPRISAFRPNHSARCVLPVLGVNVDLTWTGVNDHDKSAHTSGGRHQAGQAWREIKRAGPCWAFPTS